MLPRIYRGKLQTCILPYNHQGIAFQLNDAPFFLSFSFHAALVNYCPFLGLMCILLQGTATMGKLTLGLTSFTSLQVLLCPLLFIETEGP